MPSRTFLPWLSMMVMVMLSLMMMLSLRLRLRTSMGCFLILVVVFAVCVLAFHGVVDELYELECFADFGADFGEFEEVY